MIAIAIAIAIASIAIAIAIELAIEARWKRSPGFFTLVTGPFAGGQLQGFKGLEVACKCHRASTGSLPAPLALCCVTAGGTIGKKGGTKGGGISSGFFTVVTGPCAGDQLQGFKKGWKWHARATGRAGCFPRLQFFWCVTAGRIVGKTGNI